jgi:rhamnulokinase
MGVETPKPVINDRCAALNFTNEGGIGGTTRLLKNITGLWIVQECRRIWQRQGQDHSWESLAEQATAATPLASLIDPDHADFATPGDMPQAIREYCRRTGQHVPESVGAVVRAALEGVALKSRWVLAGLEELVGGRIETVHIVGGGTQNKLLCQLTADACGRRALAGPVEATAIGNVLAQLMATGAIGSMAEARQVAARWFPLAVYTPTGGAAWDEAYGRFLKLLA